MLLPLDENLSLPRKLKFVKFRFPVKCYVTYGRPPIRHTRPEPLQASWQILNHALCARQTNRAHPATTISWWFRPVGKWIFPMPKHIAALGRLRPSLPEARWWWHCRFPRRPTEGGCTAPLPRSTASAGWGGRYARFRTAENQVCKLQILIT